MIEWNDFQIIPKAPLMFRDGKPFGADAAIATTLPFPRPSTLCGAMRTAWAESQDDFCFDQKGKDELLSKQVKGPLLLEFNQQQDPRILFPAPANALCLHDKDANVNNIYRLAPEKIAADNEGTDLPHPELLPVFLQADNHQKPARTAPAYWYFDKFIEWISNDDNTLPVSAENQGITNLPVEIRTHVAIDTTSLTNKAGHLFETAGLDFAERQNNSNDEQPPLMNRGWASSRYGLLMRFSDKFPASYRTIGGEARLGHIEPVTDLWPDCPEALLRQLSTGKQFCLYLITPAIFNRGYLPDTINPDTLQGTLGNLQLTLRAAAIPRWQAGTSWDMLAGKQGAGMRKVDRLVPAGAVYWFTINNAETVDFSQFWLSSISDQRPEDGYGLVVPGVWTNKKESA